MNLGSVLVTGGAGFIGRELVSQCIQRGYRVSVVDNLCAGRRENIAAFSGDISFHQTDIMDSGLLRRVMEQAEPEILFHLAAHHFIPYCNAHPRETLQVNVEGSYVVLNEAVRVGTKTAVLASSGSLYPSREDPLHEDLKPAPVDIYGVSKLMMEELAKFIAGTSTMTCVAARLFNVYGPYETNPHLIPDIVACLHKGPDIKLGNIHTKRDYIYVEDVAKFLLKCCSITSGYRVLNIGTGAEHSAEDIVSAIAELVGHPLTIVSDESKKRPVDKLHQRADTRRLEHETGEHPTICLSEGLARLLHERFALRPQS